MDFTISVESLQSIISKMTSVLKLTTDDATSMMRIEVSDEKVIFCGTSGTVHLVITAKDCDVKENGKILSL